MQKNAPARNNEELGPGIWLKPKSTRIADAGMRINFDEHHVCVYTHTLKLFTIDSSTAVYTHM